MPAKSAAKKSAIFRQVCELIPSHMVAKLARKHGVKSRAITPWSHTVSMLYVQFTHAIGLNDVCDALGANRSALASIRGAKPPSRNGLSHDHCVTWIGVVFLARSATASASSETRETSGCPALGEPMAFFIRVCAPPFALAKRRTIASTSTCVTWTRPSVCHE